MASTKTKTREEDCEAHVLRPVASLKDAPIVKARIASLAPVAKDDIICACWKCGADMTAAEVDAIPAEKFDADYPECADCVDAGEDCAESKEEDSKSEKTWDCECRECGKVMNDECGGMCDRRPGREFYEICNDCAESDSDSTIHECEDCGVECDENDLVIHSFGCVALCEDCSVKDGEPHCPRTHANHESDPCAWCEGYWEAKDKDEGKKCECGATENLKKVCIGGGYGENGEVLNTYEFWCPACEQEAEEE